MNLFAAKDTNTKTGADPLITIFDANKNERNIDQNTNKPLLSPAPNAKVNAPNNCSGLPIPVGDANGAHPPITIFDVNENEIDIDENNTIFDANKIERFVDQNTNDPLLSPAPNAKVNDGPGLPIPVGDANGADPPITIFDVNENEIDVDEKNTIPLLTLAPDAEVNAPNNGPGLSILFGGTNASAIGCVIHAVNALCDPSNDQVCRSKLGFPPNAQASRITSRKNSDTPKATLGNVVL